MSWSRKVFGAIAAAALASSLAGCGVEVDAETGKVVSDRVWFDPQGGAHCPRCDSVEAWTARRVEALKAGTKPEDPPSAVKPHSKVCEQEAKHAVRWVADDVPCWKCSGSGVCPDCRGAGTVILGSATAQMRPCGGCVTKEEEGRTYGSGRCLHCGGKGIVRYGS